MMGQTDKATINQRRPLTEGMRHLLKVVCQWSGYTLTPGDHVTGSRMRGLMDRGYVTTDQRGLWWPTDAGREANQA